MDYLWPLLAARPYYVNSNQIYVIGPNTEKDCQSVSDIGTEVFGFANWILMQVCR